MDNEHNVWMNIMNGDEVLKYDPKATKWTEYPFPTLGAETRYVSLLEKDGHLQVILPYSRTRKVARMTFRTQGRLAATEGAGISSKSRCAGSRSFGRIAKSRLALSVRRARAFLFLQDPLRLASVQNP